MKKRVLYLDVIRCMACIMVVAMHAPVPGGGMNGVLTYGINLATAPCIGLFFMVSGSLLLPSKETGFQFLKKRLLRIVPPILIWTAVEIVLSSITNGWPNAIDLLRRVFSIPLSNSGHGVLWFMYPLIGIYLLAPIISPWLVQASRNEIRFYLLIWGVTLCYPFLNLFLNTDESIIGIFYYFSGYIGYFILGYYLRKFPMKCITAALLWVPIPFILFGLSKYFGWPIGLHPHFWYLSIPTTLSCISLYIIIQRSEQLLCGMPVFLKTVVIDFSICSFGIYLIHIFIMRYFLWDVCNIYKLGGIGSFTVSFLISLLLSWGLTKLILKIKVGKYIVG